MKYLLLIWLHLQFVIFIQAQQDIEIIENTISNQETEVLDNENITDDLLNLKQSPININDTSADYTLFIQYDLISPIQVEALRKYIKTYGELLSLNELIAVPEFNYQDKLKLEPYIQTSLSEKDDVNIIKQIKYAQSSLVLRAQRTLQEQKGFISSDSLGSKYLGNQDKLYLKFKLKYKDKTSIGFLADQDSGEEFFTGSNPQGFDFYSGHISYKPKSKLIKQVIFGDYEVKIGQGLMHWNGFLLGKGADVTSVFQKGNTIKPYSSSNEFNFLRGASASFQINSKLSSQVWFSSKLIDTNLEKLYNKTDSISWIRSIQTSGLHRTLGEIEDKHTSKERIVGFNTNYQSRNATIGLAATQYKLSDSLGYSGQEYQKYLPRGDSFNSVSLHHSFLLNRFYIFGETSYNFNHSWASLQGVQHFLNSGIKASLLLRRYGINYRNQYASAFGENTSVNNEEGIYLGLDYAPSKQFSIKTYYDVFRFPWKKFRVSKPSEGNEFFIQGLYSPGQRLEIEWRTIFENKEIDEINSPSPIHSLTPQNRNQNRLEFRIRPSGQFYLKTRLANTNFKTNQKNERGFALFQDVIYKFDGTRPLNLYSRFSVFNTPSYDSRIYAYENDLLYNFFVPAYYDKGVRYYIMANFEPIDRLKFWIKFSETKFAHKETISSGNNLIEGNKRSDLKLQLQLSF